MPEMLSIAGLSAVAVAALAWNGDRRRSRRTNLDRVGIVPWTPIFFVSLLIALVLLGLATRMWIAD